MNPNQIANTYLVQPDTSGGMVQSTGEAPAIQFLYETHGNQWVLWRGQGSMKLIGSIEAEELIKNKLVK